jgi:ribosomal-protein-alanine N-acetyltransferase
MADSQIGMRVRQAEVADLAALLRVERDCEGAPHWSQAVWGEALQGTTLERAVFVAEDAGPGGFVVVSLVADVAEVESIAVAAKSRCRGVARALCSAAIEWAKRHGAAGIELEVRASNEAALRLYAGLGFTEQGRRGRYYRDPVEDALLMRLPL